MKYSSGPVAAVACTARERGWECSSGIEPCLTVTPTGLAGGRGSAGMGGAAIRLGSGGFCHVWGRSELAVSDCFWAMGGGEWK
jgi:hypothetical protein